MKFNKMLLVLLVVLLAALMVACGGDSDDGGDSGGSDVNLSQEISGPTDVGGTITMAYPEGWVAGSGDDGSLTVASSAAVLTKMDSNEEGPSEGEAAAIAMFLPAEMLSALGLAADASPGEATSLFLSLMTGDEGTVANMGDPVDFESNGKSGGMIFGTVTEDELAMGVIMAAVSLDNGFGLVMLTMHPDEVDDNKDLAQTMAGKLEVSAPE